MSSEETKCGKCTFFGEILCPVDDWSTRDPESEVCLCFESEGEQA